MKHQTKHKHLLSGALNSGPVCQNRITPQLCPWSPFARSWKIQKQYFLSTSFCKLSMSLSAYSTAAAHVNQQLGESSSQCSTQFHFPWFSFFFFFPYPMKYLLQFNSSSLPRVKSNENAHGMRYGGEDICTHICIN